MSLLSATGLTKRFDGLIALHEVDLEVDAGEAVGIVGPNGAGKTTLFDCLLGLQPPDHGTVRFLDRDVTHLPVEYRARMGMARTFQRLEVFPELTPREHVLVADRGRTAGRGRLRRNRAGEGERVDRILSLVGLTEHADTPAEALGLGFGRLIELARALAVEPRLLMLDEPSSGLDRSETALLAEVVAAVRRERGTTVVVVEHDLDLVVRIVGRMIVLDAGKIVGNGPPVAVLREPAVRRAYLGDVA